MALAAGAGVRTMPKIRCVTLPVKPCDGSQMTVRGQPQTKPGTLIDPTADIALREQDHPYVSRGALKLVKGLDAFAIDPANRVALDIGASTGGFTDVLLRRGATKVY